MTVEAPLALMGFTAQEHVELGARMSEAGLDNKQVRAFVSIVEAAAKQLALSMVPMFMELTQDTHRAACRQAEQAVFKLPSRMSYVDRGLVLQAIRTVANATPTHDR